MFHQNGEELANSFIIAETLNDIHNFTKTVNEELKMFLIG